MNISKFRWSLVLFKTTAHQFRLRILPGCTVYSRSRSTLEGISQFSKKNTTENTQIRFIQFINLFDVSRLLARLGTEANK
jgi:hypothetical protein